MGNVKQWIVVEICIFYVNFFVLVFILMLAYMKDSDDVLNQLNKDVKNMIRRLKKEHN